MPVVPIVVGHGAMQGVNAFQSHGLAGRVEFRLDDDQRLCAKRARLPGQYIGATVARAGHESDATTQPFVDVCDDLFETALCWNMVVPPAVRRALGARSLDNDDVLAGLRVPVTVSHGEKDQVVLPAMSEHILETCKTASASWYASVGHAAMMEDAERFNKELLGLVAEV